MQISLAYSPCPNDTYIFEAIANHKVAQDIQYSISLADVQELNMSALDNKFDVSKISFATYPLIAADYQILDAGSALGFNCGPMLIAKENYTPDDQQINRLNIGIPGKLTTANLLLSIAYPHAIQKKEMLFSDIEDAILNNKIDAGLIIHENRFTYESKGLKKIIDLGEYWQENFHFPIPLGCIVVKRSLPEIVKKNINEQIKQSILYAKTDIQSAMPYIRENAQEMNEDVMMQHIKLYVNDFSLSLGEVGKSAINFLFQKGYEVGLLPEMKVSAFIER
jgi:1,4-dihydroxy-6-naphthoate synthase